MLGTLKMEGRFSFFFFINFSNLLSFFVKEKEEGIFHMLDYLGVCVTFYLLQLD